jgi:putative selenium metabolism protein SsnA
MPADLLIGPGLVATPGRLLPGAGVSIRDGRIAEVGDYAELRMRADVHTAQLPTDGRLILPGLINAHTHLYSTPACGMPAPDVPPADFPQLLERIWWRLDAALDLEDVELSALIGLTECIRCGVTTIVDHHASSGACAGSLDRIRHAVETTGVRAALCYEVSDRHGRAGAQAGIAENSRFITGLRRNPDERLAALFGLHALFTLSEATLAECVAAARDAGTGLHLHLAEDRADIEQNLARHHERPLARLMRHGGLDERTVAAHGVHLDAGEIAQLAQARAFVVHNPESNMNNAVGCAPVPAMLAAGVRVALGTDGLGADMLGAARAASLLLRHAAGDPRAGWHEPAAILWEGNRALVTRLFGLDVGALQPGAAGDLIVLDYDPPTALRTENLAAHLCFGFGARHVTSVVAAGEILMHDRKLTMIDEPGLRARARERARALWARL